jgi:hypothetical protein
MNGNERRIPYDTSIRAPLRANWNRDDQKTFRIDFVGNAGGGRPLREFAEDAGAAHGPGSQRQTDVTVIRKGIPAGAILEEIRFDASGQPQRTVLSKPEEKPMGPLRARKVAEVKESVQEVMQLAGRYANPQMLSQAIQKGEIWEGQGSLRVQSRGLILPMDEMTMLVNGATFLASRIDVKTQHEGSPVAIAIDYQQLPNGPSMVARMTVQIPGEDVVVNVESFDFVRLSPIVH